MYIRSFSIVVGHCSAYVLSEVCVGCCLGSRWLAPAVWGVGRSQRFRFKSKSEHKVEGMSGLDYSTLQKVGAWTLYDVCWLFFFLRFDLGGRSRSNFLASAVFRSKGHFCFKFCQLRMEIVFGV